MIMARTKEPIAAGAEYRFPWASIVLALLASFWLGMGAWQSLDVGRIEIEMVGTGLVGLAYALNELRRAAARDPHAIVDQAIAWSEEAAEDEAVVSRSAP